MLKSLIPKPIGVNSGIWPDLHPFQIPLWEDGRNVVFTPLGVKKASGWSSVLTPPDTKPIRGLCQQRKSDGTQHLYFGDQENIYHWFAGLTSTVGSGYSGNLNETVISPASSWSMEAWGDWVAATNGIDPPQILDGAAFRDISASGAPVTAEIFLRYSPHLIAFNLASDPRMAQWCSADDLDEWSATSTNSARSLPFRDLDSGIIAAKMLGDNIAVYGRTSISLMFYSGTPFYFGQHPGPKGVGAVSKHSVVEVGRLNYALGIQGFYQTDGVSFAMIDQPIHEWFMARMNWDQQSKVVGFHDEKNKQVVWFYPTTTGEPAEGAAFSYETQTWSILDYGRTAALYQYVFDYPVEATATGEVYFHNFGVNADGAALTSYVQSKPMDFGGPEFIKEVDAFKAQFSSLTGVVQVQIGVQEDKLDDPIVWSPAMTLDNSNDYVWYETAGRWITFKIISSTVGANWNLAGFDFFGRIGGWR